MSFTVTRDLSRKICRVERPMCLICLRSRKSLKCRKFNKQSRRVLATR